MHLVQMFLPLTDGAGLRYPALLYRTTRKELVDRFEGLTLYNRAPATGFWAPDEAGPVIDEIMVCEVLVDELDRAWWAAYRKILELRFRQDSVLVRALPAEAL